jgi:hypothetical protein
MGMLLFPPQKYSFRIHFLHVSLFQIHQKSTKKGIGYSSYNKESVEDPWQ